MKNGIYRKLKQMLIVISISTALLSGPVAGNEISKMLECMDGQRDAQIMEICESENEENEEQKHRHKMKEK